MSRRLLSLLALMSGVISACAMYHSRPLPEKPDLAQTFQPVNVDLDELKLPGLTPHPYDPARGLDMTDAAIVAVINNPQLRATRADAHAAYVQSFAVGLIPGPQLNGSKDMPLGSNPPGSVAASSIGLTYDFSQLMTSGAEQAGAEAKARQADLNLLWAEWQVAQQARVLFLQCNSARSKQELLTALTAQVKARYSAEQNALSSGDAAFDTLSLDMAALQDVEQRSGDAARQAVDQCSAFKVFLGLDPDASLKLVTPADPSAVPPSDVIAALAKLPKRRPDLVALRYGYDSADADVRKAVLAQFPSISLGITKSTDTSDVHTLGLNVTLGFPFIFGGPKQVHAAEATRDSLWQAYQQRLNETNAEVRLTQADLDLVLSRLKSIRADEGDARHMAKSAAIAYARGDLSAPAYYDVANSAINRELAGIDLAVEAQTLQISLETLLGMPPQDFKHPEEGNLQ